MEASGEPELKSKHNLTTVLFHYDVITCLAYMSGMKSSDLIELLKTLCFPGEIHAIIKKDKIK